MLLPCPPGAPGGRVVVITGGSSGIGRASALLLARRGWRVGLLARGAAGLADAHAELLRAGAGAAAMAVDVADGTALSAAAAAMETELGPVDAWVNCAGNGVFGPFWEIAEADFRRVTEVTYLGTANGMRAALALMRPRDAGVVVNICSAIAFHALPGLSSYAGAKCAVRGFTDAVRHELRGAGSRVRLCTVFPPAVNTPFFSHAPTTLPRPPRPARPVYQPEVVADAVLLALEQDRREIQVGGIVAVFAFCCAAAPWAIRAAMRRLGMEGQMTDLPEAARLHSPTLAAPSTRPSAAHGPFDAEARGWSAQMWLNRRRATLIPAAVVLLATLAAPWWWPR